MKLKKDVIINDEPQSIDWHKTFFLERYLKKVNPLNFKNIIEIGAYDCQESLTFTQLFPNAHITAFECNPETLELCRQNSKKSDRITLVEKMVTDVPEDNRFYVCDADGQSSMCFPHQPHHIEWVPSISMNEYLDDESIDLVWMDVQGAELQVLRSFDSKLKNVNTIYCEVDVKNFRYHSNSNLETVIEFLSDFNISDTLKLNENEVHIIFSRTKESRKKVVDVDLTVCDNFLEGDQFLRLQKSMSDADWEYRPGISVNDEGDPRMYYGFSCLIVDKQGGFNYNMNLDFHKLIDSLNQQIMKTFDFDSISRCRLDMTTYRGSESITFSPHVDLDYEDWNDLGGEHYTAIFYIDESDAPTIIYNEIIEEGYVPPKDMKLTERVRIYPEPNKLVVFKGNYIHTGMCPTTTANRILVNSNFRG